MEEPDPELVVPFVVCRSAGGPYEDRSFIAGYHCGLIDARLMSLGPHDALTATVPPPLARQLDLMAMRHRVGMEVEEETPDWVHLRFRRT